MNKYRVYFYYNIAYSCAKICYRCYEPLQALKSLALHCNKNACKICYGTCDFML